MKALIQLIFFLMIIHPSFADELALNWKPEPEFGGFYEALLKGYYEKVGLKINILPGGAGQPVAQMVAAKKVKYGIASAPEVILARSQGAKIVAIFSVYQHNPQGFMVHPERKIKGLKELFQTEGTIALQKGLPYTEWLEKKYAPIKATIVPYTGGVSSYIQSKNFSQQCFVFSEPIAARREKQDSQTLLISESGWDPYTAVVIVHEDTLRNEPEIARKFTNATQKGWVSYVKSPRETNIQMQKINPSLDLATFDEAAQLQVVFVEPAGMKEQDLGLMKLARWTQLYEQMQELKLVSSKMNPADFFYWGNK